MHCRVDYEAAWDIPVVLRHWWFERVKKLREEEKGNGTPSGHTDPFGRHYK